MPIDAVAFFQVYHSINCLDINFNFRKKIKNDLKNLVLTNAKLNLEQMMAIYESLQKQLSHRDDNPRGSLFLRRFKSIKSPKFPVDINLEFWSLFFYQSRGTSKFVKKNTIIKEIKNIQIDLKRLGVSDQASLKKQLNLHKMALPREIGELTSYLKSKNSQKVIKLVKNLNLNEINHHLACFRCFPIPFEKEIECLQKKISEVELLYYHLLNEKSFVNQREKNQLFTKLDEENELLKKSINIFIFKVCEQNWDEKKFETNFKSLSTGFANFYQNCMQVLKLIEKKSRVDITKPLNSLYLYHSNKYVNLVTHFNQYNFSTSLFDQLNQMTSYFTKLQNWLSNGNLSNKDHVLPNFLIEMIEELNYINEILRSTVEAFNCLLKNPFSLNQVKFKMLQIEKLVNEKQQIIQGLFELNDSKILSYLYQHVLSIIEKTTLNKIQNNQIQSSKELFFYTIHQLSIYSNLIQELKSPQFMSLILDQWFVMYNRLDAKLIDQLELKEVLLIEEIVTYLNDSIYQSIYRNHLTNIQDIENFVLEQLRENPYFYQIISCEFDVIQIKNEWEKTKEQFNFVLEARQFPLTNQALQLILKEQDYQKNPLANANLFIAVGSVDGVAAVGAAMRSLGNSTTPVIYTQAFQVPQIQIQIPQWPANRVIGIFDLGVNNETGSNHSSAESNNSQSMTQAFVQAIYDYGHRILFIADEHGKEAWQQVMEQCGHSLDELTVKPENRNDCSSSCKVLFKAFKKSHFPIDRHTQNLLHAGNQGDLLNFDTFFGSLINKSIKSNLSDPERRFYLSRYLAENALPDYKIQSWLNEYDQLVANHIEILKSQVQLTKDIFLYYTEYYRYDASTLFKEVYQFSSIAILQSYKGISIGTNKENFNLLKILQPEGIKTSGIPAKVNLEIAYLDQALEVIQKALKDIE